MDITKSPASFRFHKGFSLVETVLAIGVIAFTFAALIGVVSMALGNGKDSAETTTVSLIAQGLCRQVDSEVSTAATFQAAAQTKSTTFYFDHSGLAIAQDGSGATGSNFFRVTAQIGPLDSSLYPLSPSGIQMVNASQLLGVTLTFQWPVQPVANGNPLSSVHKAVYTYYVAKPTEPGWF